MSPSDLLFAPNPPVHCLWSICAWDTDQLFVQTCSLLFVPNPLIRCLIQTQWFLVGQTFWFMVLPRLFQPSGPFTCIFSQTSPDFPVLAVANTWLLCRPTE